MSYAGTANWSPEPAFSWWWVPACVSGLALAFLGTASVQHSSQLLSLFHSSNEVAITPAELIEPTALERETPTASAVTVDEPVTVIDDALVAVEVPSPAPTPIVIPEKPVVVDDTAAVVVTADPEPTPITASETVELASLSVTPSTDATTEVNDLSTETGLSDLEILPPAPVTVVVEEPTPVVNITAESMAEPENVANAIAALNSGTDEPADTSPESSLALLRRTVLTEMTDRSELIKFGQGSSNFTPKGEQLMQQIFEDLFLYSESDIVIEVSSRDSGDDVTNASLSNQRGRVIKEFLADRGLESERLIVSVLTGASMPDKPQHISIQANLDE